MELARDRRGRAGCGIRTMDDHLALLQALAEAQHRTSLLVADYEAQIATLTTELQRLRTAATSLA